MGVVLGNNSDNIIQVDSAGVTISSVISGTSKKLTISGAGAGVVTLSAANTYSGDTTVNNKLTLSGSGSIANSPYIILASGSTFDVSGLTTALSLGASQALKLSATGSSSTATLTVLSSKGATLSGGGIMFTAYGGGATAPLTVAGATAGALALNSAPVTVTTTTALTAGTYKLVAKSGSATGVTGTPGALTVNGSGLASNTSGALSVSGGELILTVTNNATAPQAPTIGTITPGDSQLSVAFTAPASNGGAAISGYKWSVDGVNYTTRAGTDSPIVITGLTNGTDYTVRIRAVNSVGDGAVATASSTATPITTPGAPTIGTITPGDSQLSVAFTAPASNGGAAISGYKWSVDGTSYTLRSGTSSPIVITGLNNGTAYTVRIRAVNSVGDGAVATASSPITAGVPQNPTVIVSGMSGPLSTTYGTASGERTFTVSGSVLSGNLRVTAPADLEVSTTSGENFADFITLTADGGTVSTRTIYVRLKATAAAGTYDNLLISVTEGGDNKSVSTSTGNSVSKAPLTIKGINIVSRDYNKGIDATITGTAQYDGLKNGDTFPVSGTASATFLNQNAGTNKAVTISGYTAPNNNYTLTQPSLTGTINPKPLSITAPTISSRAYTGTLVAGAVNLGSLSGFMGDETVTATATAADYPSANVGSYSTTVTYLLANGSNGGLAANYSLDSGTATGQITKATPVITFPALATNKRAGDAAFAAGASATPAGGVLSYSSSNPSVATVDASGNITPLSAGESIITVSVVADSNLNAASTSQTLRVLGGNGTRATIFSENMGTPSGTTPITSNVFENSGLTFSQGGQANPADVRSSSNSSGYAGASGSGNVYFTSISGAYGFSIEGIYAAGHREMQLSYGYRKESSAVHATFSVDYWNGAAWVSLANTDAGLFNEASTASAGWYQAKTLSLPVAAQINGLRIRFVKTGGTSIRIDDVSLTGLPAAPGITATGSFSAVSTTYGSPSAASADTVTVTGGSLAADITATPSSSAFEVSTNGSTWANSVTYAQSAGFVTGSLFLRLKPNVPAGTYSNVTVALTSGSVSADVAISASTVNPFAITVTAVATNKIYGNSDPQLTYSISPAPLFSDSLNGSLERVSGNNAGIYAIGLGSLTNGNYAITFVPADFTVQQRPLTITANPDNKIAGLALTSPQTGSTKFTCNGLAPGESISTVSLTYTAGATAGAAGGAYAGAIVPSDPVGINTNNYDISFVAGTLTVDASPALSLDKTDLPGFETTTYGTESTIQSFAVTGGNLAANVRVSAPSGFVISTNAQNGFTTGLTLTPMAGMVSTTIFVKVPGTAGAGSRSGIISLESSGATSRNVTIASSTVLPKPLTIGGLEASNRVYDATTNGTVTGTPVYEGLTNNDRFTVNDLVTWSFADKNVETTKLLSASVNFTNPSANYTVTQPIFSANITKATLSLAGAAAVSRPYAPGNTAVEITGTLNGVQRSDTVSFTGTGTIGSADAGTGLPVTAAVVQTGIDSSNYDFNQPTGLTVQITRANQTITFNAPANATVGTPTDIGATASSGLAVTFTSSNSNVATISGGSVVAVAPGVTTITVSQAGDSNYLAATSVSQILNVGNVLNFSGFIAGWDFQTTTTGGTKVTAAPDSPLVYTANFGYGTIYLDGSNGSSTWTSSSSNPQVTGFGGTAINTGNGLSTVTGSPACLGLANSTANTKTVAFKFSMTGKKNLSVSYAAQRTSTGFASHKWEISTNGTTWTEVETISSLPSSYEIITLNPITALNNTETAYLRLTVAGATSSTGNNRLDNIQLNALGESTPAITPSGTFGSLSTTYGEASSSSGPVLVSGGSLAANIIATAPTGLELSLDGSTWAPSVTFPQIGGFASGNLYVRLGSTRPAGTQASPLVTLSSGSASQTLAVGTTTVTPKALTVIGAAVNSKTYNGTRDATITGTLTGTISPDVVTLVGTGTFASANAGTGIAVTSTSTLGGAAAGNYILTQPTGLTGTISKATPVLGSIPTASAIRAGQALSNSTIFGGTVSPSGGTWAWSNPGNINTVEGTNSYAAVYTPALADQGNYLSLTTDLSVTVDSAGPVGTTYSGWLISNGANGSDAAFWDYVYGAKAPGQLPASLRPTTMITGGKLVLTYYVRQNTLGLTVTAKKSLDLAAGPSGWNIDGVNDVPVETTTTSDGVSVQKRTASVEVIGANKKFLKLEGVQAQ